ncbi:MAG TPA: hypothetical protein VGI39_32825 [Polyangiaceae bacterium]|jgi:hypothetical protein
MDRLTEGVWHDTAPVRIVGMKLTTTMTVLDLGGFHDRERAPFADAVVEVPLEGFRLVETVLVHRPSSTVVVADLVHNVGRPPGVWERTYTKMMGFYDRVALSGALRWTAFSNRAAARRSVDALLGHSFERVVVGHGRPIAAGAHAALEGAMAWLPAAAAGSVGLFLGG